jgi:hypothetical protein
MPPERLAKGCEICSAASVKMTNDKAADRESYLRWQALAITQLGYTINLLLTLAGAALAFGTKILMESQTPASHAALCFFCVALLSLALSVVAALSANVTRAVDFRNTRRAARERMKDGEDHDKFHEKAERFGKWTWRLFYLQTLTFAVGVISFALGVWSAYGSRV